MEVLMPKKFDLEKSLEFCKFLDELENEDNYVYDYKETKVVEPFGMLIIGSKIRRFVEEREFANHGDTNFKSNEYAAHMGYFQSIYQDFGKMPGEAKGNSNYIPITYENFKEIYNKLYFGENKNKYGDINDYIENNIAEKLAGVVSRQDRKIKCLLKYCICELIRNVHEHSKSENIWYSGQYWPTKDLVEIAILDEGEGILESLKKNKKIEINNHEEALRLSIEPGVSSTVSTKNVSINDNQGFGLYMTKNICDELGDFVICSGDSCLFSSQGKVRFIKTSFKGTIVRIRLKVSKIKNANNLKIKLSQEGTEKSKELIKLHKINVNTIKNI